jgi:hypothetical protein
LAVSQLPVNDFRRSGIAPKFCWLSQHLFLEAQRAFRLLAPEIRFSQNSL